jgi:hypothetical protein
MRRDELCRVYLTCHSDGFSAKSLFNYPSNGLDCLENVGDLFSREIAQSRDNALRHNKYIWNSTHLINSPYRKSYCVLDTHGQAGSDVNLLDQKRACLDSCRKPFIALWRCKLVGGN